MLEGLGLAEAEVGGRVRFCRQRDTEPVLRSVLPTVVSSNFLQGTPFINPLSLPPPVEQRLRYRGL